jgi:hypothetical protein
MTANSNWFSWFVFRFDLFYILLLLRNWLCIFLFCIYVYFLCIFFLCFALNFATIYECERGPQAKLSSIYIQIWKRMEKIIVTMMSGENSTNSIQTSHAMRQVKCLVLVQRIYIPRIRLLLWNKWLTRSTHPIYSKGQSGTHHTYI